jgi:hypothetical protein
MFKEVICEGSDHRGCVKMCEHSIVHSPMDGFGPDDEDCANFREYCSEIDEEIICIPIEEFKLKKQIKKIKKHSKKKANAIMRDIFKGL